MRKTWLLGFGFFSISMTWALYNAFVPLFLENFLESIALIGFMMTIDNYFALFLQPWIGNRSDKTNTRFGKRMPYLLIGMPLAALFLVNENGSRYAGAGRTLVVGILVMAAVALAACTGPTLRALRIDPNVALKGEG